jgi:ketosteroid isomerase-like protein
MLSRCLAKGETNMSSDDQEIRNLVATWMAATKAGDIEKVLSLMAEDVVFLLPRQPPGPSCGRN